LHDIEMELNNCFTACRINILIVLITQRKAEDATNQDVDESKKSKVEDSLEDAVENGHPTNGHTDTKPTAVAVEEETPAVESTEDLPVSLLYYIT